MNQTNKTTAQQINAKELVFAKFKLMCDDSKNAIMIKKGKKMLEIKYNEATDLYVVNKIKIKGLDFTSDLMANVYCDQLKPIIEDFFKFEYVMHHFIREVA